MSLAAGIVARVEGQRDNGPVSYSEGCGTTDLLEQAVKPCVASCVTACNVCVREVRDRVLRCAQRGGLRSVGDLY